MSSETPATAAPPPPPSAGSHAQPSATEATTAPAPEASTSTAPLGEEPLTVEDADAEEAKLLQHEEDAEKLRASLDAAMITSRPRDALHGLGSGLVTIATGIVAGVAGLVIAPVAGAVSDGAAGFAKGLGLGLVGLVALPVAGLVGGAVQIGRGVYNTPEAIREKMDGKVWNKTLGIWEEAPGDALQAYDEEAAKRRLAIQGNKPSVDYYAVLELRHDASADQIRKAYFLLARTHHPDKNPGDETAKERFQAMGEAYQVLSDPRRKAAFDRDGQVDTSGTMNASMFFNMVFGSELFDPLVGELSISTMARTADVGGLTATEQQYHRNTRIMKLVVHLGEMVAPFIAGDEATFKAIHITLSEQLAAASFGETMLHTLGEVYQREADVHLKNFFESGLLMIQAKKEEIKSQFAAVKAVSQLELFRGQAADADVTGMTSEEAKLELAKRAALEAKGLTLALAAMWAANRADIQATVRSACRRFLKDASVASAVHHKRAKALHELGAIFLAAQGPSHLAGDSAQFTEALRHMQEGRGAEPEGSAS